NLEGGQLALHQANTYTGGTNLGAGVLTIGNASSLGDPSSPVTLIGGTLQGSGGASLQAGAQSLTVSNPINLTNANTTLSGLLGTTLQFTGNVNLNGNNTLTISHPGVPTGTGSFNPGILFSGPGVINGTGGLSLAGTGAVQFSGAN